METGYESLCDIAIARFKQSVEENQPDEDIFEDTEFPHWNEISQKVKSVWSKNYSSHLKIFTTQTEIESHLNKFHSDVVKIFSKRAEYSNIKKYFDCVIEFQVNKIRRRAFNLDKDSEQKENIDTNNENHRKSINPNSSMLAKPTSVLQPKVSMRKKDFIKTLPQYEMAYMLRAHSKENNMNDNTSLVSDAAFELASFNESNDRLYQLPSYTNLCATCGVNVINLIDVESGKIVKRFSDEMFQNKTKESYNRVCWTRINGTSVLVGGGLHGQIKVILPKLSICLSRIDAHKNQINCLLFHYKYSNILLSASDDHKIKIWRISIKEAETDLECECSNELLGVIEYKTTKPKFTKETVLSMCFIPNDYLIISTIAENYYVKLDEDKLFNRSNAIQLNSMSQEMNNEDTINYMTTAPDLNENIKTFKAQVVYIEATSENNLFTYQDNFVTNKLIFYNNHLIANLVESNLVYFLSPVFDDETKFLNKLILSTFYKVGEDKTQIDCMMNIFKENEIMFLMKAASNGCFYNSCVDSFMKELIATHKYKLPQEYSIKKLNDNFKVNFKNFGLLTPPKTISCVSNGKYILLTTNQNIIAIWRRVTINAHQLN